MFTLCLLVFDGVLPLRCAWPRRRIVSGNRGETMSGAHAARGLVRGRHRVSRSRAWRLGALVAVAALLAGVGLVAGSVVRAPAARADNGLPGQTYYYDSFRGMLYFPALWPSVYGLEAISAEFDCDYGVDGSAHVTGFRTE